MTKLCRKCNMEKPDTDFPINRSKPSGRQSNCKDCTKKYTRDWKRKNINKNHVYHDLSEFMIVESNTDKVKFEKYYITLNGRASHMLNNAKRRALNKGIEFSLSKDWITDRLRSGVCEVTKIPFEIRINGGKGHTENSFAPSIDRIDSSKGYTAENCQLVCWIYNRAKGAFPLPDLLRMAESIIH